MLESLISTFILAVALVAVLGAVFIGVYLSGDHRKLTTADVVLKNISEQIKGATYATGAATYAGSAPGHSVAVDVKCIPAGVSRTIDASTALVACSAADSGLQVVSISVTPDGGGAVESSQILKRRKT